MATVREITALCKSGQIQEAYDLARNDLETTPADIWVQREVGWALYYQIKNAAENCQCDTMLAYLDELKALELLSMEQDQLIFDNVLFKVAEMVRKNIRPASNTYEGQLSSIFHALQDYEFHPSAAYSRLLQGFLQHDTWSELGDCMEWWNLDKLTEQDFVPYVTESGNKLMTLAERAYIAYAKVLLKQGDSDKIEAFMPKLESLTEKHPEMMYPGYFYGKLLMSMGRDKEETLKALIPFVRKKSRDFWVWQLLGEVFHAEREMQMACLLRAVNCRTQEGFLKNVRIKLASLYIQQGQYGKARYHADRVIDCCVANHWALPSELQTWIHQPWMNTVAPNQKEDMDYMGITNSILCHGADESVAIVTYIDTASQKVSLIYGYKQRMSMKLRFKVKTGTILKIHYTKDADDKIQVIHTSKTSLPPEGLLYIKRVHGKIEKREGNQFAFLKGGNTKCFVSPKLVQQYNLHNGTTINAIAALDYERKKDQWNWNCIDIVP